MGNVRCIRGEVYRCVITDIVGSSVVKIDFDFVVRLRLLFYFSLSSIQHGGFQKDLDSNVGLELYCTSTIATIFISNIIATTMIANINMVITIS